MNAFWTEKDRDDYYVNCLDDDEVKLEISWKKEDRLVEYHNGQNQFKVPFAMYADFKSILKPVGKHYKDNMNILKSDNMNILEGKSYTE